MSGHIQYITDYNQYLNLVQNLPCVVKFTADWCGPCRRLSPVFYQTALEKSNLVNFLEINIDHADEIADYENVTGIPLVLFYNNGVKQQDLKLQGLNIAAFESNIQTFIANIPSISGYTNADNCGINESISSLILNDEDFPESSGFIDEIPIVKTITEDMIQPQNFK